MSISLRLGIAWGPDFKTSEPTDTLVLTGKTYFIDQRLFPQLTPTLSPVSWAFAGTRSSQPVPDKPGYTKCSWTHLVSSVAFGKDEKPTDEGVLGPHPAWPDNPAFALETGRMVNPDTGVMTDYKEYWQDNDAKEGDEVVFWEYGDDETGPEDRGFVGIVGQRALGVGRVNEVFWTWRANKSEDGNWKLERSVLERDGRRRGWGLLNLLFETIVLGTTTVEDELVSGQGFHEEGEEIKRIWIPREAWKVPIKQ
ncbi:uncharacterized protein DFL_000463 [Arthrobotrys flagrans]|uniref:Protein HRI1 n=1 Tax=Arthrobotrys flagrans TaxID=97331 RepID=A0A437AE76_ARTFL|nr:hypothetical protein DFL_000463 [Arthrobotrys flagrans]